MGTRCLAKWARAACSALTGVLVGTSGEQGAAAAASASRGSAAAEEADKCPVGEGDAQDFGERGGFARGSSGGTGRSCEAGAASGSGSVAQVPALAVD